MAEMLTNPGFQLILLLLGLGIVCQSRIRRFLQKWRAFQQWQALGQPLAAPMSSVETSSTPTPEPASLQSRQLAPPFTPSLLDIPTTVVPKAANALMHPPASLWYAIDHIQRYVPAGRFTFPLGWYRDAHNEADLFVGHLVGDINGGLVTAIQGGGKDTFLLNMVLTLTALNTPDKLQVAIIDGKGGLDYIGWRQKKHVWYMAEEGYEILELMTLLTAERRRRVRRLKQAGVSKWENYVGTDMPMLVVIFSELKVLETEAALSRKEIERFLTSELSVWRGLGMRMFVCTQNSSNWSKEWRAAFEFFVAGTQPSRDEDKPNTGRDSSALRASGIIPPSELPSVGQAPGVMSIIQGHTGMTVRTSHIDDTQRGEWLARMPDKTVHDTQVQRAYFDALLVELAQYQTQAAGHEASLREKISGIPAPLGVAATTDDAMLATLLAGTPSANAEPASPVTTRTAAQEVSLGYDPDELARVIRTTLQKDLPDNPTFVAACQAAYKRHRSYMGVIKEFWESYNGDRNEVVKRALNGPPQPLTSLAAAA